MLVVTPDVVAVTVVAASADVASSTIVTLAFEINSIWLRSQSIFSLCGFANTLKLDPEKAEGKKPSIFTIPFL